MIPLHRDHHFTFRFGEARVIPRFHLDGPTTGQSVSIFKIDPITGERLELMMTANVGAGGWVELPVSIYVNPGDAFIAVPN
jgi:hypothetical protein